MALYSARLPAYRTEYKIFQAAWSVLSVGVRLLTILLDVVGFASLFLLLTLLFLDISSTTVMTQYLGKAEEGRLGIWLWENFGGLAGIWGFVFLKGLFFIGWFLISPIGALLGHRIGFRRAELETTILDLSRITIVVSFLALVWSRNILYFLETETESGRMAWFWTQVWESGQFVLKSVIAAIGST